MVTLTKAGQFCSASGLSNWDVTKLRVTLPAATPSSQLLHIPCWKGRGALWGSLVCNILFLVYVSPLTPPVFFFFIIYFIYFYGCVGSSFLCEGFLQLRQVGSTLHRGAQASHYRGLSFRGAQAPDAQAQQLWLTGPAAPWHVGSSQTRARTRVPCIGRQTVNHCATREAHPSCFCIKAGFSQTSSVLN